MSQNIPAELSIGYGLVALCQKIGARSSWLQYEQRLVDSNMPHAEQRLEKLTKTITKAQNDYQAVGRALETLFFGFGESYVVVVLEGDFAIGFLFPKELEEFNDSIVAGRRFLRTNRAKVFERLATEDASLRELHLEPEEHQQSSEPASEPQVNVAPALCKKMASLINLPGNSPLRSQPRSSTRFRIKENGKPSLQSSQMKSQRWIPHYSRLNSKFSILIFE